MEKLEFHDVANIFPMMSKPELKALEQDIKTNGLLEPIWLYKGKIIDGRNRYLACLDANVKPMFREYTGTDADLIDFVISLNLHRRHLSTSQKACLAVEILPELEKRTKENLSKKISAIRKGASEDTAILQKPNSSETASNIFGVSERYIFDAKKLLKVSPNLFNDVRQGKTTLQKAKKQLRPVEDTAILQKPHTDKPVKLTSYDLKKVRELVNGLNISEEKARGYILSIKAKRKPKSKNKSVHAELKVRIRPELKERLKEQAKEKNISVSEMLRELLNSSYK